MRHGCIVTLSSLAQCLQLWQFFLQSSTFFDELYILLQFFEQESSNMHSLRQDSTCAVPVTQSTDMMQSSQELHMATQSLG